MRETPILGLVVIEIGCIILFCLYLNIYTSSANYLLVKYIDSRKYISYKIRIRNNINTVIRVNLDLGAKTSLVFLNIILRVLLGLSLL